MNTNKENNIVFTIHTFKKIVNSVVILPRYATNKILMVSLIETVYLSIYLAEYFPTVDIYKTKAYGFLKPTSEPANSAR